MHSRFRNAGMPQVSIPVLLTPFDLPQTANHSFNLRLDINITGVDIHDQPIRFSGSNTSTWIAEEPSSCATIFPVSFQSYQFLFLHHSL